MARRSTTSSSRWTRRQSRVQFPDRALRAQSLTVTIRRDIRPQSHGPVLVRMLAQAQSVGGVREVVITTRSLAHHPHGCSAGADAVGRQLPGTRGHPDPSLKSLVLPRSCVLRRCRREKFAAPLPPRTAYPDQVHARSAAQSCTRRADHPRHPHRRRLGISRQAPPEASYHLKDHRADQSRRTLGLDARNGSDWLECQRRSVDRSRVGPRPSLKTKETGSPSAAPRRIDRAIASSSVPCLAKWVLHTVDGDRRSSGGRCRKPSRTGPRYPERSVPMRGTPCSHSVFRRGPSSKTLGFSPSTCASTAVWSAFEALRSAAAVIARQAGRRPQSLRFRGHTKSATCRGVPPFALAGVVSIPRPAPRPAALRVGDPSPGSGRP